MAKISFNDISFTYEGSEAETIKGFQLAIEDGEILSLLGKSGSGKTTLLKIMAGLLSPQKGRLCFDNEDVTQLTAKKRDIAQVFQFPVLYDSMNVEDNVKFPLRIKKLPEIEVLKRFERVCSLLELDPILKSKSKDLSLYQRQIVSIARAFVRPNLKAVFLDEPLTALSPKLKWQLRKKIKTLQREDRVTMVFVTHDQTEALSFADRVGIIDAGTLVQLDEPKTIYERPLTTFVGDFIGNPGMNFLPVEAFFSKNDSRKKASKVGFRAEWAELAEVGEGGLSGKVVGFEADRTRDHQPYGTTYIHSNFGQMRVRGAYQRLVGKTVSVRLTSHLFFDSNDTLINEDG